MKRNLTAAAALLTLTLAGCQSEKLQAPDASELYTREFIKKYGIGSLDHEWNTATRIVTDVDPQLLADAETVKVYTCWPGNPDCEIVASYDARTGFEFDYPAGLDRAYVQILDSRGKALYAEYCTITDGHLSVAPAKARDSRAEAAQVFAYDLSRNRGLGMIPVDKDYNSTFWQNFTTNKGDKLAIDVSKLKYPDYTELRITVGTDSGGEEVNETDGYTFNDENENHEWLENARVDGGLPSDMISNSIILELTYSTPADLTKDAKIKLANDGWTGYKCTGRDGIVLPKTDGEKKTIEIPAEGVGNMKGQTLRIQGLNYTIYKLRFKSTTVNKAQLNNIFTLYGLTESPITTEDFETGFNKYRKAYITPTAIGEPYSAKDLVPFVGSTGVFREEVAKNATDQCNLETYRDRLQIDERMDFIVGKDRSEVSIDYMFGSTSFFNSFGYFYYTDQEATLPEAERMEALLRKPKFILMYDACPFSNIKSDNPKEGNTELGYLSKGLVDGNTTSGGPLSINDEGKNNTWDWGLCKRFNDYVTYAEKNPDDIENHVKFQAANYRLVYYAPNDFENGKLKQGAVGSYEFPLGTHIAFFVITGGQHILEKGINTENMNHMSIDNRRIQFSVPLMNKYMGNTINTGHSHETSDAFESTNIAGTGSPQPWTPFVAYQWNGQTIMGVEDGFAETENGINGSDHDMNDMLLRVNGSFVRDREELNPDVEKPTPHSWVIACEDLGGSHDFDFNDVVFGVSHIAGEGKVTVTALAAGGTLPAYIEYNGSRLVPEGSDGGELHSWWGAGHSSSTPINAHSWSGPGSLTYEITGENLKDFTLTDLGDDGKPTTAAGKPAEGNMGGFKVIVEQADGTTTTISAPGRNETTAPQMFLAPRAWLWPREGQCIDEVYNGFIPWDDKWWTRRDGINASNIIFHSWRPGQE